MQIDRRMRNIARLCVCEATHFHRSFCLILVPCITSNGGIKIVADASCSTPHYRHMFIINTGFNFDCFLLFPLLLLNPRTSFNFSEQKIEKADSIWHLQTKKGIECNPRFRTLNMLIFITLQTSNCDLFCQTHEDGAMFHLMF